MMRVIYGILVHRDYEAKTVKAKVLKLSFKIQARTELKLILNGNHVLGCFIPHLVENISDEPMPWEA